LLDRLENELDELPPPAHEQGRGPVEGALPDAGESLEELRVDRRRPPLVEGEAEVGPEHVLEPVEEVLDVRCKPSGHVSAKGLSRDLLAGRAASCDELRELHPVDAFVQLAERGADHRVLRVSCEHPEDEPLDLLRAAAERSDDPVGLSRRNLSSGGERSEPDRRLEDRGALRRPQGDARIDLGPAEVGDRGLEQAVLLQHVRVQPHVLLGELRRGLADLLESGVGLGVFEPLRRSGGGGRASPPSPAAHRVHDGVQDDDRPQDGEDQEDEAEDCFHELDDRPAARRAQPRPKPGRRRERGVPVPFAVPDAASPGCCS
jgi:hypothetical protein